MVRSVGRLVTTWSRFGRPSAAMSGVAFTSAARTIGMSPCTAAIATDVANAASLPAQIP